MSTPAVDVIAAKRDGREIPAADLRELVLGYVEDSVADYQMAALLMAGCLRGFSAREAQALTEAMLDSGERLDLSRLSGPTVDKHSTGGVSDATTLVVAPLAAELGMRVLKLSGRGLGHTGGTLDKLDAIPGMRTELSMEHLFEQVEEIGLAIAAQTAELVPADRAMYALRDVTATVDDPALIASSIMSKKLAGGADSILLDVKVGSGAFMPDLDAARSLAKLCVGIGRNAGRTTGALISDMSQPLGDMVGNAVEVREAVETLRGERAGRFLELCLDLTARLAALAGVADDPDDGRARAERALESGAGAERFRSLVAAQGGDARVVDDLSLLPSAPVRLEVEAERDGWLSSVDTRAVGRAAAALGAGRRRKEDEIDPAVGLEIVVDLGDRVERGQPLARVLAREGGPVDEVAERLLAGLEIADERSELPPLVHDVVWPEKVA